MFFEQGKQTSEDKEKKIETLRSQLDFLQQSIREFYGDDLANIGDGSDYIQKLEQEFHDEQVKEVQEHFKKLDEKLELDLNNIRDPKKLKSTYNDLNQIAPHWLFVR